MTVLPLLLQCYDIAGVYMARRDSHFLCKLHSLGRHTSLLFPECFSVFSVNLQRYFYCFSFQHIVGQHIRRAITICYVVLTLLLALCLFGILSFIIDIWKP